MNVFEFPLQLRWSDLDPNFHLRHSVYYDWAALCRMEFLLRYGMTPALMKKLQFGPVILREEAVFRKEIHYGEAIQINLKLVKSRRDYSRWTIAHEISKADGTICAIVSVDGAWLDTAARKLILPPQEALDICREMPVGDQLIWED